MGIVILKCCYLHILKYIRIYYAHAQGFSATVNRKCCFSLHCCNGETRNCHTVPRPLQFGCNSTGNKHMRGYLCTCIDLSNFVKVCFARHFCCLISHALTYSILSMSLILSRLYDVYAICILN